MLHTCARIVGDNQFNGPIQADEYLRRNPCALYVGLNVCLWHIPEVDRVVADVRFALRFERNIRNC